MGLIIKGTIPRVPSFSPWVHDVIWFNLGGCWVNIPGHYLGGIHPKVIATIDSLPVETHPMTQLSVAMLALQKDSKFFKTRGQWLPGKDLDHHLPTQKTWLPMKWGHRVIKHWENWGGNGKLQLKLCFGEGGGLFKWNDNKKHKLEWVCSKGM